MASLETNGTRIAYQQFGEGPDLIMVHGLAANRAFWMTGLAPLLRDHFRITLYDLRGHGYSATPPSGYSAVQQADDLAALMTHLNIRRAPIVAHSFGGAVALEFAVKHPDRVSQLALLDAKINRLQPTLKLADCDQLTPFEQELIGEVTDVDWAAEEQIGIRFLETVAERRVAGIHSQITNDFVPFADRRGNGRDARHWLRLLRETTARAEFVSTDGASPEAIAELTLPVLLMYGEHSRVRPSGERLKALLPNARAVTVPRAGHFFPARAPRVVLQALAPLLGLDLATPQQRPSAVFAGWATATCS
ncbi:MAG: alpha/beta hydrolase [Abyssibacter sp.]|uniref:alpha/beta fold hydrolase n=1 Tax=Abyssibacter sp. TaxID=2320200 RepID=UPI002ECD1F58|nr:alpha/beta hydrolase [Pseudomonadota bacterium]